MYWRTIHSFEDGHDEEQTCWMHKQWSTMPISQPRLSLRVLKRYGCSCRVETFCQEITSCWVQNFEQRCWRPHTWKTDIQTDNQIASPLLDWNHQTLDPVLDYRGLPSQHGSNITSVLCCSHALLHFQTTIIYERGYIRHSSSMDSESVACSRYCTMGSFNTERDRISLQFVPLVFCQVIQFWKDKADLCCNLVYRTNTFPLVHAGFFHAFMNILALTPLLERFEAEYGTLTTLALFLGRMYLFPSYILDGRLLTSL